MIYDDNGILDNNILDENITGVSNDLSADIDLRPKFKKMFPELKSEQFAIKNEQLTMKIKMRYKLKNNKNDKPREFNIHSHTSKPIKLARPIIEKDKMELIQKIIETDKEIQKIKEENDRLSRFTGFMNEFVPLINGFGQSQVNSISQTNSLVNDKSRTSSRVNEKSQLNALPTGFICGVQNCYNNAYRYKTSLGSIVNMCEKHTNPSLIKLRTNVIPTEEDVIKSLIYLRLPYFRKKGLDMNVIEVREALAKNEYCYSCGDKLLLNYKKHCNYRWNIIKIHDSLPYSKDNIKFCCMFCSKKHRDDIFIYEKKNICCDIHYL